jgi:hypothetical protein
VAECRFIRRSNVAARLIRVPVGTRLQLIQVPKGACRHVDQISMAHSNIKTLTRTASALQQTANLSHCDYQNRQGQNAHRNLLSSKPEQH